MSPSCGDCGNCRDCRACGDCGDCRDCGACEACGVEVLDLVVLAVPDVEPWLRSWRAEYLPGARERGMSVARMWQSWTGPDTVAVRVLWSLPDARAFYAARSAANRDPSVPEFWARTDALAVSRDRQVLQPVDLESVTTEVPA
ncbi:NIPSNAP family protein [Streptomyces luteolus]|uniref:NIPSNAP family protein n=1 Tax=Streptomyces luteolus TaxID=3043615 RepID=A0ABT6SWM8_9ACTN|nr:NIPSNAP family protein [Streptomyces sp. B-S-A12]MDI3419067.1 NIPSNAP family protein [Streptomyces sp. B-S-A12]